MFRLDHEISKWCSALETQGHLSASQVDELRDHLYSEIEAQQAHGVTAEQAFHLAVGKLGPVDQLTHEYAKNGRFRHALGMIANLPFASQLLGLYLVTIACLMSYSTAAAWYAYASGQFVPPNRIPLVFAIVVLAAFGWSGFKGVQLLRGRALSLGALAGLLALVLIQVPIVGGLPANGYEFSGGLQYALLFGPGDLRFEFHPVADIHINSAFSGSYFGMNVIALLAALFIGLTMICRWHEDDTLPTMLSS